MEDRWGYPIDHLIWRVFIFLFFHGYMRSLLRRLGGSRRSWLWFRWWWGRGFTARTQLRYDLLMLGLFIGSFRVRTRCHRFRRLREPSKRSSLRRLDLHFIIDIRNQFLLAFLLGELVAQPSGGSCHGLDIGPRVDDAHVRGELGFGQRRFVHRRCPGLLPLLVRLVALFLRGRHCTVKPELLSFLRPRVSNPIRQVAITIC